jgi:hypothetical protein
MHVHFAGLLVLGTQCVGGAAVVYEVGCPELAALRTFVFAELYGPSYGARICLGRDCDAEGASERSRVPRGIVA